jgi:hypothetical protein
MIKRKKENTIFLKYLFDLGILGDGTGSESIYGGRFNGKNF